MTNYINVFKMIYSKFSKWGIRLPMCSESPEEPLTESRVRMFVSETIARTQDQGDDPIKQAMYSEVHAGPISPNLHPEMTDAALLEWVMQSEEMEQALMMFRGQRLTAPDEENSIKGWEMDEEEVGMTNLSQLLLDLTATDSDWQ